MTALNHAEVARYFELVRSQFGSRDAGEHAYRPPLYQLMRSFPDVEAVNDPKRSAFGAPDFVFQKRSNRNVILGYAEAKDIDKSLDKVEQSEQMRRYAGYNNLFLTNYREFRFYTDGERDNSVEIAKIHGSSLVPQPDQFQVLAALLGDFLNRSPEQIVSGKQLAMIMGAKARRIRDDLIDFFDEGPPDNTELVKIYNLMRRLLVHDLDQLRFADMYAQTLVYGLFIARFNDPTPDTFTRVEARSLVPRTNPFLLNFFDHIVGPTFDERLGRAVDELCEVFRLSDIKVLVHRHIERVGAHGRDRDPIIYFYEDFLEAYDADLRRAMGAYYTPLPVVRYIVRQVDRILKDEFGISRGLADSTRHRYQTAETQRYKYRDRSTGGTRTTFGQQLDLHRVQILDPAVGTATFLNEIVEYIYANRFAGTQEGRWPEYVREDLLPRLNGFEYMMAPYTIAHLKLGMTLEATGAGPLINRLKIYLTNSLEEGIQAQPDLFTFGLAEVVTEESIAAAIIKSDHPIMVVIGNPPYSAQSSNNTPFANNLVAKFKFEPGGQIPLQEKKHWLHDDYIKFLALAEDLIVRNGEGVLAMITAHGYLHNATSRGVRWRLAQSFDKIYALDLHGNVKRKERSPDGEKDENVFDIQQGVSVILAIKQKTSTPNALAEVYVGDLWGSRRSKFARLDDDDVEWERLELDPKWMRFARANSTHSASYEQGISITDLFLVSNTSLVTARDKVVVDFESQVLERRIKRFIDPQLSDEEIRSWLFAKRSARKYPAGDTRGWKLPDARKAVRLENIQSNLKQLGYRPFDTRWVYYSKSMVDWPRLDVMRHMVRGPNVGLVFRRQMPEEASASYFFISDTIISDGYIKSDNKGSESIAPLYLYDDEGGRRSNLNPQAVHRLAVNLELRPSDMDIFDFAYGVVYTPSYRNEFRDRLKEDFPRLPIPQDDDEFEVLRAAGARLRSFHLLSDPQIDNFSTTYPIGGSHQVGKLRWEDERVWINDRQFFGGVPHAAWTFVIGAYRPALKWLEQRRGRQLSSTEIDHFQRIIRALIVTVEVMDELEEYDFSWSSPSD